MPSPLGSLDESIGTQNVLLFALFSLDYGRILHILGQLGICFDRGTATHWFLILELWSICGLSCLINLRHSALHEIFSPLPGNRLHVWRWFTQHLWTTPSHSCLNEAQFEFWEVQDLLVMADCCCELWNIWENSPPSCVMTIITAHVGDHSTGGCFDRAWRQLSEGNCQLWRGWACDDG